jgi:protein NrfD
MQTEIQTMTSRGNRPMLSARRPEYTGPTYYAQSPIKPSKYGALVWSYTYVAGIAGGAQIIATVADFLHRPRLQSVVRNGRYLAMAGPTIGSVLLIADLHTPKRWYNMLRIFRKTSPMSIGSYIFSSFGVTSGITAAGQLLGNIPRLRWLRPAAKATQVPAALTGAGMCIYTGALLSSTSTPLWAAAPRLLTMRFACSAMATAAAALSLGEQFRGDRHNSAALDRLAMAATMADTVLAFAADKQYAACGLADALHGKKGVAIEHKLSTTLEHVLPLVCYGINALLPKQSRALSVAGALGVLAGGLLMRATVFHAGNRSASHPHDYLGFTQPAQQSEKRSTAIAAR